MAYLKLPFTQGSDWKDVFARTYKRCSGLGMSQGSIICADSDSDIVSTFCESGRLGPSWCTKKLKGFKKTKGRDTWVSVPETFSCQ